MGHLAAGTFTQPRANNRNLSQPRRSGAADFLVKFWNGGQQYLRNNYPTTARLRAIDLRQWLGRLLDGERQRPAYYGLIESLYLGQNERGWFVGYYDDDADDGRAHQAYDLTGNAKYLNQAGAFTGYHGRLGRPVGATAGVVGQSPHTKATAAMLARFGRAPSTSAPPMPPISIPCVIPTGLPTWSIKLPSK
jgi:hypothetical protein